MKIRILRSYRIMRFPLKNSFFFKCVERISESSTNEQNPLCNPHENITYFYYLKLILFRISKILILRPFF